MCGGNKGLIVAVTDVWGNKAEYCSGWMWKGDLNIVRFISLVLMFVVSIMFLIISPNIIIILLG
jgi:NADH:ubiquinone oxidoreductase subunit 5 (subunit L)/multisubunit Na+/H+ antiporter MnhA subunit